MSKFLSCAAIASLSLGLLSGSHVDCASESYDTSILLVGDWGADLSDSDQLAAQKAVTQAMIDGVTGIQPPISFIIGPGDNLYPTGLSGVASDDAARIKTSFTDAYSDPLFQKRWYLNLGNHDYQGVVDPQLNRSDDTRWYMPTRYYQTSFAVGSQTADMFVLDTNPSGIYDGSNSESAQMTLELSTQNYTAQMTWFENALKQSTADWCIVVGHHTIYASKASHCYAELQSSVSPLLERYGCVYISGHKHDLEHNNYNGVDYFVSGAGSQQPITSTSSNVQLMSSEPWTLFKDTEAGYMTIQMNSDTLLASFYNYNNDLLYQNATARYRVKA